MAALVVERMATVGRPLALGVLSLLGWRRSSETTENLSELEDLAEEADPLDAAGVPEEPHFSEDNSG